MRILLINYAYFKIGGPETYMFNVKALLESHGHEVIPFSLNFTKNEPCEYADYFAESPAGPDTFFYDEMKKTPKLMVKMLARQFYSPHVYRKLKKLIKDTNPDVVYALHFLKRLSPSIFDACHRCGVPVVVRLSDFGLICANNILCRNGHICQDCEKNQIYGLKYKCVKGSFFASLIRYLAHRFHEMRGIFKKIDTLICPSQYMTRVFSKHAIFGQLNVMHIPTFIDNALSSSSNDLLYNDRIKDPQVLYFGRLDPDKGVDLLIHAVAKLKKKGIVIELILVGTSSDPNYEQELRTLVTHNALDNVKFLGFLQKNELFSLLRQALVSIIPPRGFDNMPNSLIESQLMGVPVIASNSGSFPDLISNDFNGYLFESGNSSDLAICIKKIIQNEKNWNRMHENSKIWVNDHCSPQKHYEKLINVFSSAINRNKNRAC